MFHKKVEDINHARIGLILSREESRAKETLTYLSEALSEVYSRMYNIGIGYANSYRSLGELDKMGEMMTYLSETRKGLSNQRNLISMDYGDIWIFTILAVLAILQEDRASAKQWLLRPLWNELCGESL